MLGSEHPFVRATEALRRVRQQVGAVAVLLAIGVAARIASAAWSWALIGSAAVVLAGLLMIRAALRQQVRDEAINLLLTGYENASIGAVQNERRRLLAGRTRRALGRTYLTIARQAQLRAKFALARPLFQCWVVRDVVEELIAIGRALEADQVGAPAVARAERLISDGTSSLYGSDPRPLRLELQRILDDLRGG
jgi:hypothetical protein